MIYGGTALAEVIDSERPDFLVRYSADSRIFGVEVTEFYQSDTNARLNRIPGYVSELLDGRDFRRKYDRKVLNVAKKQIEGITHTERYSHGVTCQSNYPRQN
jgi:hypothetical protein